MTTRVLVCDASPTFAAQVRRLLEHEGTISVVGTRATAEAAIAAVPTLKPDLLMIDLDLPGMNGFDAIERLMASQPLPILVVADGAGANTDRAQAAIAAGALDTFAKSDLGIGTPADEAGCRFRRRVALLANASVIRHPRGSLRSNPVAPYVRPRPVDAVGVVASTGGPPALKTLLRTLPRAFAAPIFVVQHMAPGFTSGFAQWLGVPLAEAGALPDCGVWVAPEGGHLLVERGRLVIDRRGLPSAHCPSGDLLLRSLAAEFGARAVAVVLSGMGSDGAAGVQAVRNAGGFALAQDEATSAIFGMPKVAAARGVDLVLPIETIAPVLARLSA
jgi:two-component system chemotaxis response regulator CheB